MVTLPLVLLAIPSVIIGAIAIEPMLFGEFFKHGVAFKDVIFVGENHHAMEELRRGIPRLGADGDPFA